MNPPAPEYRPAKPFSAHFEGRETVFSDYANAVTVETVTGCDPDAGRSLDEEADLYYADSFGHRELVKLDTNYKPTRPGNHPVCLTRADAIRLAAALLEATEDTFNVHRCGALHPRSAAALLQQLEEVDGALFELRQAALGDLVDPHGPDAAVPTNDSDGSDSERR